MSVASTARKPRYARFLLVLAHFRHTMSMSALNASFAVYLVQRTTTNVRFILLFRHWIIFRFGFQHTAHTLTQIFTQMRSVLQSIFEHSSTFYVMFILVAKESTIEPRSNEQNKVISYSRRSMLPPCVCVHVRNKNMVYAFNKCFLQSIAVALIRSVRISSSAPLSVIPHLMSYRWANLFYVLHAAIWHQMCTQDRPNFTPKMLEKSVPSLSIAFQLPKCVRHATS